MGESTAQHGVLQDRIGEERYGGADILFRKRSAILLRALRKPSKHFHKLHHFTYVADLDFTHHKGHFGICPSLLAHHC